MRSVWLLTSLGLSCTTRPNANLPSTPAAVWECPSGAIECSSPPTPTPTSTLCVPREAQACAGGGSVLVCSESGFSYDEVACTLGRLCRPEAPGECVGPPVCTPGDARCIDGHTRELCSEEGGFWESVPCAESVQCVLGRCMDDCALAELRQDYIGCSYRGVDLGNFFAEPDDVFDFAFIVSNSHHSRAASVSLLTEAGVVDSVVVEPGQLGKFVMPPPRPRHNKGTGIRRTAFRIESDLPIAAYQFNPLQTAEYDASGHAVRLAASTDASLLIPEHALDSEYRVVAWEQTPVPGQWLSFTGGSLMAIAAGMEPVTVRVAATAMSAVGPGVSSPTSLGATSEFALEPYEVLQLTTVLPGQDWTGTVVTASAPVAVFGGNECARVPLGSDYCDHLEEQLLGLRAWGKTYVAAKTKPRGAESDVYRVLADEDGTQVTFSPAVHAPLSLDAGEFVDVVTTNNFVVDATGPILVAQFLQGSRTVKPGCDPRYDCSELGDPSMMLLPPSGQYRQSYVFLTPDTYQADYATLILTASEPVLLDGAELSLDASAIADSGLSVATIALSDGPHLIESQQDFAVMVYGYGGNDRSPLHYDTANVSYGYPAGLNLLPLNPKDPL